MSLCRHCGRQLQLRSRSLIPTLPSLIQARSVHQHATLRQSATSGITFDPYHTDSSALPHTASSSSTTPSNPRHPSSTSASHASSSASASTGPIYQPPPLADDGTEQLRLAILDAALKQVPTHGWTDQALQAAIRDTAYSPSVLSMLQPEPAWCLAAHFWTQSTHAAFAAYHALPLHTLNKQQRTTRLLHTLLAAHAPYQPHLPALLGLTLAPTLSHHALPLIARLTDDCLHALQDASTGSDWYGRRMAFAGVWLGGLAVRGADGSVGCRDSLGWVERRVGEWVGIEERVGEVGVLAELYGHMAYNAFLKVLAGKQ